jgi:hypothetical protein
VRWREGQSGNKKGRPSHAFAQELREYLGKDAKKYLDLLKDIVEGKVKDGKGKILPKKEQVKLKDRGTLIVQLFAGPEEY